MGNVRKGMTLIELVVAIVLTGILAGLGAVIIRQVIDSWNIVSSRAEASSQMNIALSRMSRPDPLGEGPPKRLRSLGRFFQVRP